ncbi:MAG: hypothetical protein COV59_05420 [Candidatus Magasanikbacteria bacterium CG11_big_fil_rev_8_21_14_0_20_39_34]|uniref:Uncharacterized protein n=1 Tax=Candidatus Magasanikbacteria bacterium CG11_big_fil_rev_8_21_14_0_20_39_34 TaxID=1974653 RepID=A0A2H0N3W8_9BACT|nr:MAG: hypothetical protein COV59_05420 [Candidatus Magasanikbacteria bacterium CG11_big_fil_rev_8_21_14_0_20_39_34]
MQIFLPVKYGGVLTRAGGGYISAIFFGVFDVGVDSQEECRCIEKKHGEKSNEKRPLRDASFTEANEVAACDQFSKYHEKGQCGRPVGRTDAAPLKSPKFFSVEHGNS